MFEVNQEVVAHCRFGNQAENTFNDCVIKSIKENTIDVCLPYGQEIVTVDKRDVKRLIKKIDDDELLYKWGLENIDDLYKLIRDSVYKLFNFPVRVEKFAPKEGCLGDLYIDIDGIFTVSPCYYRCTDIAGLIQTTGWQVEGLVAIHSSRYEPADVDYNELIKTNSPIEASKVVLNEVFKFNVGQFWCNYTMNQHSKEFYESC